MDKDGTFLDLLDDEIHQTWKNGEITNVLRSLLLDAIQEVRDTL